jgi:conjugative transfer signal peptidase TraF
LPAGLYVVTSDPNADPVEFCPSGPYTALAFERGYRTKGNCPDGGAPLMKPVAARPGDAIEISKPGVSVNGRKLSNSVPLAFDTSGRTLQHWPFGKYSVEDGTVWVISSYNGRSFDSRYFGPISQSQIRHRLHALLTQ